MSWVSTSIIQADWLLLKKTQSQQKNQPDLLTLGVKLGSKHFQLFNQHKCKGRNKFLSHFICLSKISRIAINQSIQLYSRASAEKTYFSTPLSPRGQHNSNNAKNCKACIFVQGEAIISFCLILRVICAHDMCYQPKQDQHWSNLSLG